MLFTSNFFIKNYSNFIIKSLMKQIMIIKELIDFMFYLKYYFKLLVNEASQKANKGD